MTRLGKEILVSNIVYPVQREYYGLRTQKTYYEDMLTFHQKHIKAFVLDAFVGMYFIDVGQNCFMYVEPSRPVAAIVRWGWVCVDS